jgi:hypothetical protein
MADCCFSAERRSVDGGTTSQLARLHAVPLRPAKGAADRRRSSSSVPSVSLDVTQTFDPPGRSSSVAVPALGDLVRLFGRGPKMGVATPNLGGLPDAGPPARA